MNNSPKIILLKTNWLCIGLALTLPHLSLAPLNAQYGEVIFKPIKIDGPKHDPPNHTYWFGPFSETASVLDVDGDGDYDIAAGRNWYEAPLWIKHQNYRDGAEQNGPETESNSEFAMDVNFDGHMDIVSSGWMFMKGAYWYKNPGNTKDVWESHKIHQAFNMEGVIHGDMDGDGDEDVLVNHWGLVDGQGMTWIEHIDQAPWFVEHVVGRKGETHGNGMGDINMDGRTDIITSSGWYEQPARISDTPWPFHEDWNFVSAKSSRAGSTSHPDLVHDVNEDGLNDVIIGSAHAYGLAWYEQRIDSSGKRQFERHWIETDFSVFHTLALGDLNGDGKLDLVAGKRLMAHYGGDIGAFEPLFAFWYDIQGGKFERHILSYNHLPYYPDEGGINPPPNFVVGVGMKINIYDMNHDGRNDVILAGKGGLYLFTNQGPPPTPSHEHKLPDSNTYPTWREWGRYKTLFNGKDFSGWKVPEGDNGHWTVKNFVIDYDALSEAKNKNLWTQESFGDFNLHLDWRFKKTSGLYPMPTILPDGTYKKDTDGNVIKKPTPNADSGILLRGAGQQVNLWNWAVGSGELWSVRNNESLAPELRAAAVPKVHADNPIGQWNSMDLSLVGDRISVMLNGKKVIENAQIPGLPERGPIGLQHHGGLNARTGKHGGASSLIQFRNIWIDRLDQSRSRVAEANDSEGMKSLFNGKSLDGWLTGPDNAWVVENGVLTLKREMDGKEHNVDYLWTEETYDDFILELEFKVPERANSGVFIRTSDIKDPVYTGIEIQVANSYGSNALHRGGTAGALYDLVPPTKNTIKRPGEWNYYRIICKNSRIRVELNGEQVIDSDLAKWTTPRENPDGTPNKFPRALAEFARTGHIGLQDHGRPVWYRNIRVKRLTDD